MGELLWRFFKNPVTSIILRQKTYGPKKKKKKQTHNPTTTTKKPNKRADLTLHCGESSVRWLVTVAAAPPPPCGGVSWTPS